MRATYIDIDPPFFLNRIDLDIGEYKRARLEDKTSVDLLCTRSSWFSDLGLWNTMMIMVSLDIGS
jgi:hypothetical protein